MSDTEYSGDLPERQATATEVREAATYVLIEITLRKKPRDDDKMFWALDVLGEDLFTRLWGHAAAIGWRQ